MISRRKFMTATSVGLVGASRAFIAAGDESPAAAGTRGAAKSVAAVVTVYRPGSHAEAILGKILTGWEHDGGPGPALTLASMYVDQFPRNDLARGISNQYKIPIFDTIAGALTLERNAIAVDGVLIIGEHGDYPMNDLGQRLYPRRRFFEEVSNSFAAHKRVVPVFNDKHLGPVWDDAKWMYDRAGEMKIPLMAGSSLPVSYRSPLVEVPLGSPVESAVGVGYGELDKYGIHALECYQALVERRAGAETGVKWVQCLQGPEAWTAVHERMVNKDVLDAALAIVPKTAHADVYRDDGATLFLFEYCDGLQGAVLMLPSISRSAVGLRIRGKETVLATSFEERSDPHYPHFAYLLKAIETMVHTGRPTYPVERTLLSGGILDRVLRSRARGGPQIWTPELAIAYQPVAYPHAPNPDLNSRE